ncbi:MAG: acyl carrier protein [Parvibaculaceae bacterium]
MTDEDLQKLVTEKLFTVAPEFEGETIEPETPFRDQFEIDSMDFLNFIIAVHEATGINIPEADYPQMETLKSAIAYLKQKGAT